MRCRRSFGSKKVFLIPIARTTNKTRYTIYPPITFLSTENANSEETIIGEKERTEVEVICAMLLILANAGLEDALSTRIICRDARKGAPMCVSRQKHIRSTRSDSQYVTILKLANITCRTIPNHRNPAFSDFTIQARRGKNMTPIADAKKVQINTLLGPLLWMIGAKRNGRQAPIMPLIPRTTPISVVVRPRPPDSTEVENINGVRATTAISTKAIVP